MDLSADFVFQPLPPIEPAAAAVAPDAAGGTPLGQLANLSGSWSGSGFNVIWRPHHPGQDHFLELNVTTEELTFSAIPGAIPNRGLLQNDITMHGLSYLQQIQDTNIIVNGAPAGLHFEPGLWLNIPVTTAPPPVPGRRGDGPGGDHHRARGGPDRDRARRGRRGAGPGRPGSLRCLTETRTSWPRTRVARL